MFPHASHGIFREDFDAHFHRSVERAIDVSFEDNQVSHSDGIQKIQVIHRRRNHLAMAVPVRGYRAGDVDHVHYAPAQNISEEVRVLRKHKFRHFGARSADRPARQQFLRLSLWFRLY
jgi:hypothetical protein